MPFRSLALLAAATLAGCCFATNSPEPCHEHAAQSQRFRVTGACGPEGVIELTAPAGAVCDFTVSGAASVGLPPEGSLYGPGTAPLGDARWFLGWAPRDPMPSDAVYRQCRTEPGTSGGIELICEDRVQGAVQNEICRAHLAPE